MNQATFETKTHLRPWFAFAIGVGFTAALTVLAAAPWPIVIVGLGPPAIAHAAIFDLALRRPEAMPIIGAFMIGILLDVVAGPIFGLGAITALSAHFAATTQRRFLAPRGLAHAWIGLVATALALGACSWLVASLYFIHVQPLGPSLAQVALTAALYPPVAILLKSVRLAAGLRNRRA